MTQDTVDQKFDRIFDTYGDHEFHQNLVQLIEQHPVLINWITNRVKNDSRLINLIREDWKSILKNNLLIQEYLNNDVLFTKFDSKTNKLKESDDGGGMKNSKLYLVECTPLQCVAEIMCQALSKNVLHNSSFFFKKCNALCATCKDYQTPSTNIWCVKDSMVYNHKLNYAFREYCESLFQTSAKAIVHLEIGNAYSFGEQCKIGGNITSVIFIDEIINNINDNITGVLKMDANFMPAEKRQSDEEFHNDLKRMKHNDFDKLTSLVIRNESSNELKETKQDNGNVFSRDISNSRNEQILDPEITNRKYSEKWMQQGTSMKNTNSLSQILAIPKNSSFVQPSTVRFDVETTVGHI